MRAFPERDVNSIYHILAIYYETSDSGKLGWSAAYHRTTGACSDAVRRHVTANERL